jgi:hypothetical protein
MVVVVALAAPLLWAAFRVMVAAVEDQVLQAAVLVVLVVLVPLQAVILTRPVAVLRGVAAVVAVASAVVFRVAPAGQADVHRKPRSRSLKMFLIR